MGKNPQDIKVTEPTASTVENSPVVETPKVPEPAPANVYPGRLLKPNQSYTQSGCIRTDN